MEIGYSGPESDSNNTSLTYWTKTTTCLDDSCDELSVFIQILEDSEYYLTVSGIQTRITEAEFISGMNQAYEDYNVLETIQVPIPMESDCFSNDECPSDESWCESGDPSCSSSPYQEPDGKVRPAVIAGFTVAGFVVLVAVLYIIHAYLIKKRDQRNRIKFATRVAQTMSIRKSARSLTPGMLEKEFNKIDKEHRGQITKEALWEFLNSGKAGEIKEHDFEALWAVMHHDESNSVDFLEFCAYMAQCHDEYNNAARGNGRSISVAASLARMSVARSVSLKVADGVKEVVET
mmetsp:Transcript_10713/g.24045  ORF Transcript_10713/g.24045 Transcript_10713/m.24045 type:complete len:291 (+) Transcript_10713:605-1477(+)